MTCAASRKYTTYLPLLLATIPILLLSNWTPAHDIPDPCDEDPCDEPCIAISLTSDILVVAEGGNVNFTVSVDPNTDVYKVVLTYEGEAGQDEDYSAPYTFIHQFNNPTIGFTVTATVEFTSERPDCVRTLNIDVVGLTISGPGSPTRGSSATYTAQSNPPGQAIDQFNWTYSWTGGGSNTYQDNDSDDDDVSNWTGTMVVAGTLACSATISGADAQASQTITVTAREWSVPITCAEDNEADWGGPPTAAEALGQNRDRDSNITCYIFVPRNGSGDFTPARTLAEVQTGPCEGWWYVSSSILVCQRETVINKYAKSGGPLPTGATVNFYDRNNQHCFNAGNCIQAIKNHEYRGTPSTYKSVEGHQGRIENAIVDQGYDAKKHIESLTRRDEMDLEWDVDIAITSDENEVNGFASDESYMQTYGPNWGPTGQPDSLGYGQNSRWNLSTETWSSCVWGPDEF